MKKLLGIALASVTMMGLVVGSALAAPSAKVTANAGDIKKVEMANGWTTIMKNTIKTSTAKDLFMDISLESGLLTDTKVTSKQLQTAMANANALVKVRVLVDGKVALPGEVVFNSRKQTVIAQFAGDLTGCLDAYGHVIIDPEGTCILPETFQLILETMNANSFNFIQPDVNVGTHTIQVQAMVEYDVNVTSDQLGQAAADAYVGKGSATVESVRMIRAEDTLPELF